MLSPSVKVCGAVKVNVLLVILLIPAIDLLTVKIFSELVCVPGITIFEL